MHSVKKDFARDKMKFKKNFLQNYLNKAPIPLAVERSLECNILSKQKFIHPILDIGCGDGLFAYILFEDMIDTGIDSNSKELKRAKSFNIYKELIYCHAEKIPKRDSSYNTIFSNSVLEHIPDLKPVLTEVYRLLVPGGRFYVTVPTERFDEFTIINQILTFLGLNKLAKKYRQFFNNFWKHYNYHKEEDWKKIFENIGFKVIKSQQYCSKIICLFNDFFMSFSFFNFLIKKIFNKWILFERLRRIYIHPFYLLAKHFIKHYEDKSPGGIIFFCLTK